MSEAVLSPCIKVCTLDPSGQLCLGCFRTIDEIGLWSQLSNGERAQVVTQLSERRSRHEASGLARSENCGTAFHCGANEAEACWCTAYPPVTPSSALARCLCPFCLASAAP